METIAPLISALTTAIAVMSAFWIYRKTEKLNSVNCIFAGGIIIYTLYHFFACGMGLVEPVHGAITGLFISSTAIINAYCSTYANGKIRIGVDRRKTSTPHRRATDERRQVRSHLIFKEVNKA